MRLHFRGLAVLAAIVALAVPAFAATPTTAAPAAAKGTSIAPCNKAKTSKLNAGFMCDLVFVPKSMTKAVVAKIAASPSMEVALADPSLATATTLATAGGEGGTCSLSGCYQWFTNIHSGYDAVGSYGWRYSSGAYQRIGTITWGIDDYLTSPYATNTNMCWTTDHSAPGVYLISEMYWATTGGSNGPLTQRKRGVSTTSTVLANAKPGKCYHPYLNDNTRAIYLNYHYVSWQAAGFPGKWWAYNKSWIYGKEAGTALRFYSPVKYGAFANDAEWQPTL